MISKKNIYLSIALLATGIIALYWYNPGGLFSKCKMCNVNAQANSCSVINNNSNDMKSDSTVLVSAGDKPLYNLDQFDEDWNMILESDPNARMYAQVMPEAKLETFKTQAKQKIILEWLRDTGKCDQEFNQKLKQQCALLEQMLAYQKFQEYLIENKLNFSEEQIKEYYKEHKSTNRAFQQKPFLEQVEAVKAKGVVFENEDKAKEFLAEVESGKNFDKVADEFNTKVQDFGKVSQESYGVEDVVREELLKMDQFPALKIVEVEGTKEDDSKAPASVYYVVKAISKHETEYAPFDKVKDAVTRVMLQENYPDAEKEFLDQVKKNLNIEVRSDFFDDEIKNKKEELNKELQKLQAQASQGTEGQEDSNQQSGGQSVEDIDINSLMQGA